MYDKWTKNKYACRETSQKKDVKLIMNKIFKIENNAKM